MGRWRPTSFMLLCRFFTLARGDTVLKVENFNLVELGFYLW